jgi:hypothetical protein
MSIIAATRTVDLPTGPLARIATPSFAIKITPEQDTNVRAVVDAASRTGRGYLAVRVGQVLLYLEDRVAFDALTRTVHAAGSHADAVYGEPRAIFALAEARARRNFEPGRRPRP